MDDTDVGFLDRPDIAARLAGYRLVSQLAETAMSEVFLAVDTAHANRRVVVKVVGEDLLKQPTFRERFDRESHIALTLHHPNVVPAYAAGESSDGQLCYLVMRYVEGANLARILHERGPLSFAETLDVLRQVAHALDFAHAEGLVHRDIKPANILVERDTGHVYVCDFGIAKNLALRTVTILGPGTPFYAAPEQLAGEDVTPRSDVYSLARVALHCLTGVVDPVHLPNTPVNRVLRKAMARDPARRHGTCAEFVKDLESGRRRQRVRRLSAAVGIPAIAMVALLVAWLTPGVSTVDLARLPEALRDCSGSGSSLRCTDPTGQQVTFTLHTNHQAMYAAYDQATADAGTNGQSNCAQMTSLVRRYPDTGPLRGQAVCSLRDGVATIVWTDEQAGVLGRAQAANSADLERKWAGWVGADVPFPSADEAVLREIAAPSPYSCLRASDLDEMAGAVAGITCVLDLPQSSVSYYRFASTAALATAMGTLTMTAYETNTASCKNDGFVSPPQYSWLGVDLGQVLCRGGMNEIDWSVTPLVVLGRVYGTNVARLGEWWSGRNLTPLPRIVAGLNAQTGFPTAAEQELLQHIPDASRRFCVRPPAEQVRQDIGTTPAVAVACGQLPGGSRVTYYRFKDPDSMRTAFRGKGDYGPTCGPTAFDGEHGSARGRLRCGVTPSDVNYLQWTDDAVAIAGFARGDDPAMMMDWWNHDAGPL